MRFTAEERRLAVLYYAASRKDTISALWDALPDIDDNSELASAWSALGKLGAISDIEFEELFAGVMDHAS